MIGWYENWELNDVKNDVIVLQKFKVNNVFTGLLERTSEICEETNAGRQINKGVIEFLCGEGKFVFALYMFICCFGLLKAAFLSLESLEGIQALGKIEVK